MFINDYMEPNWTDTNRVHNWKNYATDRLKNLWHSFDDEQRYAIADVLERIADAEEWE